MQQSDLLALIKKIPSQEFDEIGKFIRCTAIFKSKQYAIAARLLELLADAAPEYTEAKTKKEYIYRKLFVQEQFTKGKIEKVMVDLRKALETYLLFKKYFHEDNELMQTIDLAEVYREKKMELRHQQAIKQALEIQQEKQAKSLNYYQDQFDLDWEIHTSQSNNNTELGDVHIPQTLQSLNIAYYSIQTELYNRLLLQNKSTPLSCMEQLDDMPEPPGKYQEASVVLKLNVLINNLLKASHIATESFNDLHKLLLENESQIDPDLQKAYYAYLKNICLIAVRTGNLELKETYDQLVIQTLEKGFLTYDGLIPYRSFHNVVLAALRLKKQDWLYQFLTTNKDTIQGNTPENPFHDYFMALYYFSIKNYDEAFRFLPVDLHDVAFSYNVRRLEVMLYYETNSNIFFHKMDAFKMLLSRSGKKNLSDEFYRPLMTNFINFLYQISSSLPGDKARSEKICDRILAEPRVADRDWLLEKAREIGSRKK
ncbi:MAG: hypothetical protein JNJ57_10075 [Saprospiraceae bacterium]|nr:hypothetical protein [Saprospiraceae bacterium]